MGTLSALSWEEKASEVQDTVARKIQIQGQPDDLPQKIPRNVLPIFQTTTSLSAAEREITEIEDATALLANIHRGIRTAEETVVAFCKRASIAHRLVNCLMD